MTAAPPLRRARHLLAQRLRGWSDDHTAVEQRLKDLETFGASQRRRWGMVLVGAALLVFGYVLGLITARPLTLAIATAGAALLNLLAGAVLSAGWYRWWHIYLLALFDVLLAATLVVFFGPGGFVAAFYLAVLPYTFDQGRGVGDFLVLAGSLGYLGASALHAVWFGSGVAQGLTAAVYVETLVFIGVALALKRIPAALIERIRITRGVMGQVEGGALAVRAPAQYSDELGFLERSLNRMLDEIAKTIAGVQREADEVAAFADVLAEASEQLLRSSETIAGLAAELAAGMGKQQSLAQRGREESTAAAEAASALRMRAERTEQDVRRLVNSADHGRESVGRASETLLAIGREVHTTAAIVEGLSGDSERIGAFNQTIAKIARQTHLLALNAAIEAARAEEHGEGFAAVAEQVRALAGEAGRSARDAAELIAAVRSRVEAVAGAMAAGETHVRDVGSVADDARQALDDIHGGAREAAELVIDTAAVSREQAERMAGLAEQMSAMVGISERFSRMAQEASSAMRSQRAAMESLHQTGRQLAALAERLRGSIAQFSVLRPEQVTSEHRALSKSPT